MPTTASQWKSCYPTENEGARVGRVTYILFGHVGNSEGTKILLGQLQSITLGSVAETFLGVRIVLVSVQQNMKAWSRAYQFSQQDSSSGMATETDRNVRGGRES